MNLVRGTVAPDFEIPAGRIAVLGDSRPRDYLEMFLEDSRHIPHLVFEAVARERPVAAIHCGDLAVYGSRDTFWQGWTAYDQDARALTDAAVPLFPVPGNHEYRGWSGSALDRYFSRFPHILNKRFYSLRSGGLLFLILDSNFGRLGSETAAAQDAWLQRTLDEADADPGIGQVVPVVHHPPFTNISRRYFVFESRAVQRRFVPHFRGRAKLRLVFSGHVHTYEHILEGGIHFIVTGGGGSPRFLLRPKAKRRRDDVFPRPGRLRPFHYVRLTPGPGSGEVEVEVLCLGSGGSWSVGEAFTVRP